MAQIAVKTSAMSFPAPLGRVSPGANFATQSAPLTQNILPDRLNFATVIVQADINNAGNIYICSTAAQPDTVGFLNVFAVLSPGMFLPWAREFGNVRNLTHFFIGAANATDGAICSVDEV